MRIQLIALIILFFSSCSNDIKPEQLYGRWNYIEVINADPEDKLPEGELESKAPVIIFNKNDSLTIEWGGKKISAGKFRMDGRMIRYTEDLPNNQKREFPFLIKSLNETELVFQTMVQNSTTVTARKGIGKR